MFACFRGTLLCFVVLSGFLLFPSSSEAGSCVKPSTKPLFVRVFGQCHNTPVLYLHGGPGDSSVGFELSVASALAKQGYYVITYDRRGEGRSPAAKAPAFTYKQALADLHGLVSALGKRKKVVLFGHSFGGVLGLRYLNKHKSSALRLILSGTPIDFPATLQHLADSFVKDYPVRIAMMKKTGRAQFAMAMQRSFFYTRQIRKALFGNKKLDRKAFTARRVGFLFVLAMQFQRYTPKTLSKEAQKLYFQLRTKAPRQNRQRPFVFFLKQEGYASQVMTRLLLENKVRIRAVYGLSDGLFSPSLLKRLKSQLGKSRCHWMKNAGHFLFLDQRQRFLKLFKSWVR